MAVAFLLFLLFSFIPQFYWPDPAWRTAATEILEIPLPSSLSIQPWVSFEAWLAALAGLAWFYAASSWEINHQGRKWFYFAVSSVVGILALVVLWGNMTGAAYPAAERSTVFSFFPNRNQTANFLAVGGVAAFGYAMCTLRPGRLLPMVGFFGAGFSFLALVWGISRAGILLFFAGLILLYFLQLATGRIGKGIKLGFPLLLIAFSVFLVSNSQTSERIVDFVSSSESWSGDYRVLLTKDSWTMIHDAPLTGHGLGTFAAVFPQYRELSANHQRVVHPESDLLWLASESGMLGLALLIGLIVAYLARCRGLSRGPNGGYRLAALTAWIIFMLHALVDVSGHRPGTIYFAILFAALVLPKEKSSGPGYKPRNWRLGGVFLIVMGTAWGLSGITGLPLHSSTAVSSYEADIKEKVAAGNYEPALLEVDNWIDIRPMDWRAYFQRATLRLSQSGAMREAAADFRRARFLEPNLAVVALEEAHAWIPYDPGRTIAAWREVFFREMEDRESVFQSMLNQARRSHELMDGLGRLSAFAPDYRLSFLQFQSRDNLMEALKRDLEKDATLGQFSREQRSSILEHWIERGDRESAEKFLKEHESSLNRPWWLWALLRKEQANFEEAVQYIRSAITPPSMAGPAAEEIPLERLQREFSITPGDVIKGTGLLRHYIEKEDFQKVGEVTRAMIEARREVPLYVSYWQAESFFRQQDYIECWYAFEEYLEKLWED